MRESSRVAYSTLNALAAHIAVLEESGRIIAVNDAWREFASANSPTPFDLSEGTNYLETCDRAQGAEAADARAFAAGVRAVITGGVAEFRLEYPCHSPVEERWFTGRVTRFSDEGRLRVVVTHENITARKRAEAQLQRSEAWLRAIFEASRDGILVEDEEHIIYANRAYTSLLGYRHPDELIGQHISSVVSPDDRERMLEYGRKRVRGDNVPFIYEFKGRRRDGSLIELEASVSTSQVAGKDYVTTAIRDIAERKQAEESLRRTHDELERRVAERTAELAQANEVLQGEIAERKQAEAARTALLRRLVAAQEDERRRIARELHDQMGQHLTAMMFCLKSLSDSCHCENEAQERFQQLHELGDELAREVKTLAWELRPAVLDDLGLPTALTRYIKKWTERAGVPIDFQCAIPDDRRFPPDVETTLYRIVQEALTNVRKHAQASRVSLILGLRDDYIFAIIEDNGAGFEPGTPQKENVINYKLGLIGMHERVALVGGTLNIESTPGTGTSVFVRIQLPFNESEGG